jgi:hypothetical protein
MLVAAIAGCNHAPEAQTSIVTEVSLHLSEYLDLRVNAGTYHLMLTRYSVPDQITKLTYEQCVGSGSARIRNFCRIRIRNSRVLDPDPGTYAKMDVNINKNHQKRSNFIILTNLIYSI